MMIKLDQYQEFVLFISRLDPSIWELLEST
jgi:hypothetical protein